MTQRFVKNGLVKSILEMSEGDYSDKSRLFKERYASGEGNMMI